MDRVIESIGSTGSMMEREKMNEWKFKQKFKFLFNSEKERIVIIRNFWNDERDWIFEQNIDFLRKFY